MNKLIIQKKKISKGPFGMKCMGKTIGVAALTFGCGVILCAILPSGVLVCVQAAMLIAAGVLLFAGK